MAKFERTAWSLPPQPHALEKWLLNRKRVYVICLSSGEAFTEFQKAARVYPVANIQAKPDHDERKITLDGMDGFVRYVSMQTYDDAQTMSWDDAILVGTPDKDDEEWAVYGRCLARIELTKTMTK